MVTMTDARNKELVAEILGSWDAGDFAYIESFHYMSERETARSRLAPRASLDSCPQTPQRKYHKIAMLNCRLAACSRILAACSTAHRQRFRRWVGIFHRVALHWSECANASVAVVDFRTSNSLMTSCHSFDFFLVA